MTITDAAVEAANAARKKHGMSYQAFTMPDHELRTIVAAALAAAPAESNGPPRCDCELGLIFCRSWPGACTYPKVLSTSAPAEAPSEGCRECTSGIRNEWNYCPYCGRAAFRPS